MANMDCDGGELLNICEFCLAKVKHLLLTDTIESSSICLIKI